jgi:hypothetical protein
LDENAHRFWCLIAPEPTAQGETGAREAQIKGCSCNWYADTAMAQIAENKAELRLRWTALARQPPRPLRLVQHLQPWPDRHERREQHPRGHASAAMLSHAKITVKVPN